MHASKILDVFKHYEETPLMIVGLSVVRNYSVLISPIRGVRMSSQSIV